MTKQLSYSLAISRHSNLTADKVFNLFYKWLPDVYIFPPWKKSDILFEGIALFLPGRKANSQRTVVLK